VRRQREGKDANVSIALKYGMKRGFSARGSRCSGRPLKTAFHVSSGRFPEGWPEMMGRQNIGHIVCIRACCESPWAWEWKIGPQGSSSKETAFDENNATTWHLCGDVSHNATYWESPTRGLRGT